MITVTRFIAIASLFTLATAGAIQNSCNTHNQYCCHSVHDAKSTESKAVFGLLKLDIQSITGQIGFNCSPLSIVGAGGNSCNTQPVCCTGNNFNGLAIVGCNPIAANI